MLLNQTDKKLRKSDEPRSKQKYHYKVYILPSFQFPVAMSSLTYYNYPKYGDYALEHLAYNQAVRGLPQY
jgi:hypothetical protein